MRHVSFTVAKFYGFNPFDTFNLLGSECKLTGCIRLWSPHLSEQIPQILEFAQQRALAFRFAAVGVDLALGQAKDQHSGAFGEAYDKGVGIFFESDLYFDCRVHPSDGLQRPRSKLVRGSLAPLIAQHWKRAGGLFLFIEAVDETALIEFADKTHIDKLLWLHRLGSRISFGEILYDGFEPLLTWIL